MGSDHSPVHLELHIGSGEGRKTSFKWNVSYLQGDMLDKIETRWKALSEEGTFFFKLRNVARFYKQASKKKTMKNKKIELDISAKLELATASLHEDINNFEKQGEVNRLRVVMGIVESGKAKCDVVRYRVRWQQVGDKCSKEFFRSVRPKNTQAVISEFKDRYGRIFIKLKDLEGICNFFTKTFTHIKKLPRRPLLRRWEGF